MSGIFLEKEQFGRANYEFGWFLKENNMFT